MHYLLCRYGRSDHAWTVSGHEIAGCCIRWTCQTSAFASECPHFNVALRLHLFLFIRAAHVLTTVHFRRHRSQSIERSAASCTRQPTRPRSPSTDYAASFRYTSADTRSDQIPVSVRSLPKPARRLSPQGRHGRPVPLRALRVSAESRWKPCLSPPNTASTADWVLRSCASTISA
jgi:hypothetical protein